MMLISLGFNFTAAVKMEDLIAAMDHLIHPRSKVIGASL
jgi:hypothetical protein